MSDPEPSVEVDIMGIKVGFLRRDIRQISDTERANVEALVSLEKQESGPDRRIDRIVIETDYPDPDRLSYRSMIRVIVAGDGP